MISYKKNETNKQLKWNNTGQGFWCSFFKCISCYHGKELWLSNASSIITSYDIQQCENLTSFSKHSDKRFSITVNCLSFQEFVLAHIPAATTEDLMVCLSKNIACLKTSVQVRRHGAWSRHVAPSLGSTPRPASHGRACWGFWGPWLVGWAGWPAPPRWAPCPPPLPSASPAAWAAPAQPLCWSSDCH